VTASDRATFRERAAPGPSRALTTGGAGGQATVTPPFRDEDFPATMPPFVGTAVLSTPEGQIWVGRGHSATDRTWRYDIFDGRGVLIGSATLGARSRVVGFGTGTVYIARTDPDDDLIYLEKRRR
jgi:hypothetical protein